MKSLALSRHAKASNDPTGARRDQFVCVHAAVSAVPSGGVAVPAQHGAADGAVARATRAPGPAQRLPAAFPYQPPAACQLPRHAGGYLCLATDGLNNRSMQSTLQTIAW